MSHYILAARGTRCLEMRNHNPIHTSPLHSHAAALLLAGTRQDHTSTQVCGLCELPDTTTMDW